MKQTTGFILITLMLLSCNSSTSSEKPETKQIPIEGTWELLSGTTIEKNDTVTTNYASDQRMIKIFNPTHFSFLRHDLNKGKDTAIYSSGGGTYSLKGDQYTERLDFCSDRDWEGHEFQFTVSIKNDTLIQTGIEKLENLGINRLNIEKYKRVKN
jgi:hypothetical protein